MNILILWYIITQLMFRFIRMIPISIRIIPLILILLAQASQAQTEMDNITKKLTSRFSNIEYISERIRNFPHFYSSAPIEEVMELFRKTKNKALKYHYLEQLTFYRSILSMTDSAKTQLLDIFFEKQGLSISDLNKTSTYLQLRWDEIANVLNAYNREDIENFSIKNNYKPFDIRDTNAHRIIVSRFAFPWGAGIDSNSVGVKRIYNLSKNFSTEFLIEMLIRSMHYKISLFHNYNISSRYDMIDYERFILHQLWLYKPLHLVNYITSDTISEIELNYISSAFPDYHIDSLADKITENYILQLLIKKVYSNKGIMRKPESIGRYDFIIETIDPNCAIDVLFYKYNKTKNLKKQKWALMSMSSRYLRYCTEQNEIANKIIHFVNNQNISMHLLKYYAYDSGEDFMDCLRQHYVEDPMKEKYFLFKLISNVYFFKFDTLQEEALDYIIREVEFYNKQLALDIKIIKYEHSLGREKEYYLANIANSRHYLCDKHPEIAARIDAFIGKHNIDRNNIKGLDYRMKDNWYDCYIDHSRKH